MDEAHKEYIQANLAQLGKNRTKYQNTGMLFFYLQYSLLLGIHEIVSFEWGCNNNVQSISNTVDIRCVAYLTSNEYGSCEVTESEYNFLNLVNK